MSSVTGISSPSRAKRRSGRARVPIGPPSMKSGLIGSPAFSLSMSSGLVGLVSQPSLSAASEPLTVATRIAGRLSTPIGGVVMSVRRRPVPEAFAPASKKPVPAVLITAMRS
ncbi:hypothetical protein D3C83_24060 [compost metagenome]